MNIAINTIGKVLKKSIVPEAEKNATISSSWTRNDGGLRLRTRSGKADPRQQHRKIIMMSTLLPMAFAGFYSTDAPVSSTSRVRQPRSWGARLLGHNIAQGSNHTSLFYPRRGHQLDAPVSGKAHRHPRHRARSSNFWRRTAGGSPALANGGYPADRISRSALPALAGRMRGPRRSGRGRGTGSPSVRSAPGRRPA